MPNGDVGQCAGFHYEATMDLYCDQPSGDDRNILGSLLGSCHNVHLYLQFMSTVHLFGREAGVIDQEDGQSAGQRLLQ